MTLNDHDKLIAVKTLHTIVWAVFAASILAMPVCTASGRTPLAWALAGLVFLEVLVLRVNGMRCPLTDLAGRYTTARHANFDIYLPAWLARYNKEIYSVIMAVVLIGMAWRLLT